MLTSALGLTPAPPPPPCFLNFCSPSFLQDLFVCFFIFLSFVFYSFFSFLFMSSFLVFFPSRHELTETGKSRISDFYCIEFFRLLQMGKVTSQASGTLNVTSSTFYSVFFHFVRGLVIELLTRTLPQNTDRVESLE